MFPTVNGAFQLLQAWIKYPPRQAALLRKIVDRIRNSLDLQVVLQTAVDEVAARLNLDCCSFLWYLKETQQIQVVCERNSNIRITSHLGYHPLESFGSPASALDGGKLIINNGTVTSKQSFLGGIVQKIPWLRQALTTGIKCSNSPLTESPEILGYSASLLIPVVGQEGGMGFIACLSDQPRRWSAVEIEFLKSIAEPIEIAIRQAQLYEQTQKQAIRERLVNQIINQTRQSFEIETILTEAIAQLLEALQADRCLVHLVEELNNPEMVQAKWEGAIANSDSEAFRRKHLYEVYRPPYPPSIDEFDTHGPITQWVIQHRQPVLIPDITKDERISKANVEYQKAQIKSSLVVPVQTNDTLQALLYLNQCSHIRYWSNSDQELVQAVADQLAISLQQAYLYLRNQQQAIHSGLQAQKMSQMLEQLKLTQAQLIQNEKMSSLGRMVAGVAHEINNPVNFIYGNIPYVENYVKDLIRLVQAYQAHYPHPDAEIQKLAEETDIDFLLRDLPKIFQSMASGAERIREIVQLLQKFSRQNEAPLKVIDINAALESTLLILHNQTIGTIQIERNYGNLPPVECYPKAMNQAFLSILTNAIEAVNRWHDRNKIITVRTQWVPTPETGGEGRVQITIQDNGPGIKPEIQPRIFDPFFTTKDVGQGRGLGLTESYQTVVSQHKGRLEVRSQSGKGAEFLLELPIRHPKALTSDQLPYKAMTPVYQSKFPTPQAVVAASTADARMGSIIEFLANSEFIS